MKRPKQLTLLILLSLLSSSDALAQDARSTHLTRANKTFEAADVDGNGSLNASELSRASISGNSLRTWDKDRSGSFSRDEFLMFYRHLLVKSGQKPGDEFETEAKRIEKLQNEEAKKRAEAARKAKAAGEATEKRAETLTTAEKYRRAQEALNERIKKLGTNNEAGSSARELLGSRGRSVGAQPLGKPETSRGGLSESVRARLARVQGAHEDRARNTGVGRGPVERANDSLADRAANSLGGEKGAEPENSLADKLKRARDDVAKKAAASVAGRARVRHTQESLTQRARQTVGVAYVTELSDKELESLPESARQKLRVSMEELAKRARAAGWTIEQFDLEKRRLVKRAKDAEADSKKRSGAGSSQGEDESKAQRKPPVDPPPSTKKGEQGKKSKEASEGDGAKRSDVRDPKASRGGASISTWQERVKFEDTRL